MARKKDLTGPKKGMNRDKAPFDLSKVEYSFMLNGNFHDEHGSGQVNLQNEPSNIYCSGFKSGFKVIGHKYDINEERTYFFLVNPTTGCSEIGYINSFYKLDGLEQVEQSCGCKISVTLENPLENQVQTAICEYHELVSDFCELLQPPACTGCLNFSINHPIHESDIQLKDEVAGKVLYWTDGYNPPRYLQLDRLEIYTENVDQCTGEVIRTCLDCEKMRIWPLFNKPCLEVDVLQNGGNLKAGMYEVLIAYCSQSGDEISDYFSLTNPIAIHDSNNNILDQTNLDYQTNLAIRLNVIDTDETYEYFKIAVIYRNGLDGAISARQYDIYPITTNSISIATLNDKPVMAINDLLSRRVSYLTSRGLSSGNGYLFHYGMTAHREINLQPVVSLMGTFVKWATLQADENLYENGANVAKYRSYMRDEVVPLSIKFFLDGGFETANFLFVPRPPRPDEIVELGNGYAEDSNNQSILEHAPDCSGNERNKRWQFENTAQIEGPCVVPANSGVTQEVITITEESSCIVSDENGDFVVVAEDSDGGSVQIGNSDNLVDYINSHQAEIIALGPADPDWGDIVTILTDTYSEHCEPVFSDNCSTPVLVKEEILALEATGVVLTESSIPFSEYDNHPTAPKSSSCNQYTTNPTNPSAGPTQDVPFATTYLRFGEIAYERNTPVNTPCSSAGGLLQYNYVPNPPGQLDNAFHLTYKGALGSAGGQASLQTSYTITTGAAINTSIGYTNKVHTNAVYYMYDFGAAGIDKIAFELTDAFIGITDDVCQNTVRVSFFDGCSASNDVTGMARIIDITTANDPNKFWTLDSTDFPSGIAIIAIDSPMACDSLGVIDFTGSGTCDVQIDGVTGTYIAASAGNTASNFVAAYGAIISNLHNIIVTVGANQDQIKLRSTCDQYTNFAVVNVTGGMAGSISQEETYHVLQPPCGCLNAFVRTVELGYTVTYSNVTFGKRETYEAECQYTVPKFGGCDPIPHQYGTFSYWESIERYPCNNELWNSSTTPDSPLPNGVDPTILASLNPTDVSYFVNNYVTGTTPSGNYSLNSEADFRNKGIRHYKFPCSTVVPFMHKDNPGAFKNSVIYPIGFSIDNDVIKAFLDVAVENGLLTLNERARITRYEIFRGDRSVDKSIIAKGLLFDMYESPDTSGETAYHSNFPLNSLGTDNFNGGITHRGNSTKNSLFTFHSPDTSFYKPTLPNEMKVEGYQFGKAGVYYDVVEDHPTYVILGDQAYDVATALAITEVVLDLLIQGLGYTLEGTAAGTYPGVVLAIIIAVLIVVALIGAMFRAGELRYEWIETFRNLGHPYQFAYYQAAIGHYNYFLPNTTMPDDRLRGIATSTYLKEGRWRIPDEVAGTNFNVNNLDRERSVFINLGNQYWLKYPPAYWVYDNSQLNPNSSSRTGDAPAAGTGGLGYAGTGRSGTIVKNAASPYVSLKQYLPAQYGNVQSIDWVHTGFCGDLNQDLGCNPIFGGDTYISRFSLKRKFPYFTANSHGLAPRTPFEYSDYFNLNPDVDTNRYFVDYLTNDENDNWFQMFVFPANKSRFLLDNDPDVSKFYIKPPAKFYLFSYGFPYFLVESVINCNFRYAKRERAENFYPNIGDVIEFTQESNVSIREPNRYYYNFVYSGLSSKYPWRMLPDNYDSDLYAGLQDLTNTTVYSKQDNSEASLTDPWLLYRALDAYTFPKAFGKLIDMDSIESEAILARFENGVTIFGAIDQIRDRITSDTKNIGQGGIFAGRAVQFNKTDLGYGGTQHKSKVSCKFGHFWVDAKRGQVFHLKPNGDGLSEITEGVEKWLKENLPFKIVQTVSGLTQEDLDNPYKGLGIAMGWDDRSNRVFLTKLDYVTVRDDIDYQHDDVGFFYLDEKLERVDIDLTDTDYFENCSFTIAYSPLTGMWISYYSFKPNYYITYSNYFQTGINFSTDRTEEGLWSHLPFLSSYQVFYGKRYPWIIEDAMVSKYTNSVLETVEYWMDVRKYYNKYDFANVFGYGFNKAYIYNSQQNTGQLNLIHQKDDDLSQQLQYPKFNSNSIDILQSEINGKWAFNYLYNSIRNERGGLPIWKFDCNQIGRELDDRLLNYNSTMKDRMRGDYFILRLQQDLESRFKMIFRFNTDTRDYYEQ